MAAATAQTCALGIDIGGTSTKIAAVSADGRLAGLRTIPTQPVVDGAPYMERLLAETAGLLYHLLKEGAEIVGVGVGVAGFIDAAHSRMTFNPNLPWLENFPLKQALVDRFGLPVVLEVDSNAAALAEATWPSAASDSDARPPAGRLLVLSLGTGIGGGMVVDGQLLRISNECLGDVGHVIVEPGGPPCAGGCRGCAEAMASAHSLAAYAAEAAQEDSSSALAGLLHVEGAITARAAIDAAKAGDAAAQRAVERLGHYLGLALSSLTPVFQPDRIVLAGGLAEAGPILLQAAERTYRSICGPCYHETVSLALSDLGWRAVLVGAAAPLLVPHH